MIKVGAGAISKGNALLLMQAFGKGLEYQQREWEIEEVTTYHPFLKGKLATWCGSPGVTDSIGVWFNAIVREMQEAYKGTEVEIRVWYTVVEPGKHDYIADVRINDFHYLTTGINNYSGTGGSGGKLVMDFLDAVVDLLEPAPVRKGMLEITNSQFDTALRTHSDAIMTERNERTTYAERYAQR